MKSGSRLVVTICVIAAALGAWARFRTLTHAPINLEPGQSTVLRITKETNLELRGGFDSAACLDLDLLLASGTTELARKWNGAPVQVKFPDGGGQVRITNRGATKIMGKLSWEKKN